MIALKRLADVLPTVDDRLFDDHTRMPRRWSKEQLMPDLQAVWWEIFPNRTELQLLARARFARSVYVVERRSPGSGCHYSRARAFYDDRYRRDGDPFDSYRLTIGAADDLEALGLITQVKGRRGSHRETVVYATGELIRLLHHIDPDEPPALPRRIETVILRNAEGKNAPYKDNSMTMDLRKRIGAIWSALEQATIIDPNGNRIESPGLRIVFNVSFDRGGRIYPLGESWQNMKGDDRLKLRWLINGVYRPVVEIDYACLHLFLAYAEVGKKPPPGDLYQIDGFDRPQVKKAVLILINAKDKSQAAGAIINQGCASSGTVGLLMQAIKKKHKAIKPVFHSDAGSRFQRIDGQMALDVMLRMIQRTGIPALSMHDSFIVPNVFEDDLNDVMRVVAIEHGLGGIGQKTTTITPPPHSIYGVTSQ